MSSRFYLFFVAVTMCLSVAAKADVIENLAFTGDAFCADSRCFSVGNGPLTGTYTLDVTTQEVMGPWQFTTPFGDISSSISGGSTQVGLFDGAEFALFEDGTSNFFDFVQLSFPSVDIQQVGALSSVTASFACLNNTGLASCDPDYAVVGSTVLTATPEPSSLILLTSGLIGLVSARKRRRK